MIYLISAISIFLLSFFIHLLLFKINSKFTVWSFAIYPCGLLINLVVTFAVIPSFVSHAGWWGIPLSFSANLLFLLLLGVYFIFLTSILLEDESPATKIFRQIKNQEKARFEELVKTFSDDDLIVKRLQELRKSGLITGPKVYRLTARGKNMMKIICFYRKALSWQSSG